MDWGRDDDFGLKLFHEQVGNKRTDRGTYGCTMDLFEIYTLEDKEGIFKANLQQSNDLCDRHGGPFRK